MVALRRGLAASRLRSGKPRANKLTLRSPFDRTLAQRLEWTSLVRYGRTAENPEPLTQYKNDPAGFCRDILGITLWAKQIEIMEAIRDNPRVSVAACYASGKTFTAACLGIWWIYTRRPAMLVTTAPTGRQVKTLLWREIRKLIRRAKRRLPGRCLQTELHLSEDWWGIGFSSDGQNTVAGLHEENVLFIEDEAAGMSADVCEGFEGITSGDDAKHLKIGNPICDSGPFLDSHIHPIESKRWVKIRIDAEDTPNVVARRKIVPGLVEWKWVEDKRHRWLARGLLHLWETKVKGNFFITAQERVVSPDWVMQSAGRWDEATTEGPRILGVDIAGGGQDSTVAALLTGQRLQIVDDWQDDDLMAQADRIIRLALAHDVERIVIDRTGLGQGVWSRVLQLQAEGQLPEHVEVIGAQLGNAARDSKTFGWLQDEIQWSLRDALDPNQSQLIAINPNDRQLIEELSARTWTKDDKGRVKVESKKAMKRRGIGSPDRADAASLCFARSRELAFVA